MSQLELYRDDPNDVLYRLLAALVQEMGRPEAAEVVGMPESALSHAINRSLTDAGHRKRILPPEAIVALLQSAVGPKLAECLCSIAGGMFVKHAPPTGEEVGAAILDVLPLFLGDEPRKGLMRAASDRIVERRRLRVSKGDSE